MPVRCSASKSHSSRHSRYLASVDKAAADVSNHFSVSRSALIMKRLSPRYGHRKNTAHTTARHTLWVVAGFSSALVSESA